MSDYHRFKKPLIRTHEPLDRLCQMPPEQLCRAGIRGVLIDLENTLIPYGAASLPPKAKELLNNLRAAGMLVLVASNAAGSPVIDELRAEGIQYRFRCWKPFPFRIVAWFQRNKLRRHETIVIGDQALTDGLLAVLTRSHLVLVTPVSADEPAWARTQRVIGRLVRPFLVVTDRGLGPK